MLRRIEQQFGLGVATPDHVLTVAGGHGHPCPATEPQQVPDEIEPYPSVCGDGGGTGVLIYMDDTGLLANADADHPWLAGVIAGDIDPLPGLQGGVQHPSRCTPGTARSSRASPGAWRRPRKSS